MSFFSVFDSKRGEFEGPKASPTHNKYQKYFFLKNIGEPRFIILRRIWNKNPVTTHTTNNKYQNNKFKLFQAYKWY